jgi:hypothetical protein
MYSHLPRCYFKPTGPPTVAYDRTVNSKGGNSGKYRVEGL